ncbi:NUDIX hydrolase [Actinosynnema sp. CA-299493]
MADDPTQWTVRGTRRVYASEWVNVDLDDVDIPDGPRFEHHVLRFPRASTGAVVTDRDRVLLLWRHRFTTDTWGWEIPAGWSEQGEDPAQAVAREVREETGYEPHDVTLMVTYSPMTGISSQRYYVYLARSATLVGGHEVAEASRVEWIPVSDLRRLIKTGQITDGPSLTALAVYLATTGPHE